MKNLIINKIIKKKNNAYSLLELILTMLGEATTTKLSQTRNSLGVVSLKRDANEGGQVAGNTRKEIEAKTGKKVATRENYLEKVEKNKKLN